MRTEALTRAGAIVTRIGISLNVNRQAKNRPENRRESSKTKLFYKTAAAWLLFQV